MDLKIHRTTVCLVVYQNLNIDKHINFKSLNSNVKFCRMQQIRKLDRDIMLIRKKIGLKFPSQKLCSKRSNSAKDVVEKINYKNVVNNISNPAR